MSINTKGGRIMSFKSNEQESLVQKGIQIGSTFWPAPQSLWGWPPPKDLDEGEYRVIENNIDKIVMLSKVDEKLKVQVEKTLAAKGDDIEVVYKLINRSETSIKVAAWEISRLAGGVTFYDSTCELESQSTCSVQQIGRQQWYDYQPSLLTHEVPKIFANESNGWLANANNGLLMIKSFPKVAKKDVAPGESEIEVYAHQDAMNPYIEIEQQSQYVEIEPGESFSWPVLWSLLLLTDEHEVKLGNQVLVEAVKSHLKL